MKQLTSEMHGILTALFVVIGLMAAPLLQAAPEAEGELVNRISTEVVRKLQENGDLDRAIDAGIERYVARQREAQAAAAQQRAQESRQKAGNVLPADPDSDHIYGNPNARVSLIEYSDFECPFCKRFHSTAKALADASGGQVNWVYRHFPLAFHNPVAQREAEASECAAELGGNEAFWDFAERLFARTASNGKGIPGGRLEDLAQEIGLDKTAFAACMESGRHAAQVQKNYTEGVSLGVSGTPANILRNNETGQVLVRTGAQPLARMQAAVTQLIQSAPEPRAGATETNDPR